jgi:hypothetical protein
LVLPLEFPHIRGKKLRSELLDFPLSLGREVSEVYQQLPVLIFARGHSPSCLRSRFVQPAHAVVGAAATARTPLSFHSRLKGKKHKLTMKSLNVTGVILFLVDTLGSK